MVFRERVSVVKTIEFRVIFPGTDMVFCETDMVGGAGRGNPGMNWGRIGGCLQSNLEWRGWIHKKIFTIYNRIKKKNILNGADH